MIIPKMKFLNPVLEASIIKIIYKFRFLFLYVVFGVISLFLEFVIRSYLIELKFTHLISTIISINCGIFFAFWLNVNYNFKIPLSRRNQALWYFIFISLFSAFLQRLIANIIDLSFLNYELQRLLVSSFMFVIAYALHRKLSFRDFKKVGIAIYANGVEDLASIHNKIGYFPDFIHVDIIDQTMKDDAEDVKTYKLETMRALWPNTQIQSHIMSYKPSIWLDQVVLHSDVIYVHAECEENVFNLFDLIKSNGKKAGLALTMGTSIKSVIKYLKLADYVLLLTIPSPGSSGQKFDSDGIIKIKEINALSFRRQFNLCIDGGVNEDIVNYLDAENIVSGSSVLNSQNPKNQIMRLQTISRYEG
tara:strand:- start:910 stop:1992 length:1083 start_codon:yes stop_codon:yes gene_type:complete